MNQQQQQLMSKIYKLAIEVPLRLAEGESISSLVFCFSIAFWWW